MSQSEQPIELLPCPFCGGKAKPVRSIGRYVECVKCRYEILEKFWIMRAPNTAMNMGEVSVVHHGKNRDSSGTCVLETSPANCEPSGISDVSIFGACVVAADAVFDSIKFPKDCFASMDRHEAALIIERLLKPYLRTDKPVSLDLTNLRIIMSDDAYVAGFKDAVIEIKKRLYAAGVQYVD